MRNYINFRLILDSQNLTKNLKIENIANVEVKEEDFNREEDELDEDDWRSTVHFFPNIAFSNF